MNFNKYLIPNSNKTYKLTTIKCYLSTIINKQYLNVIRESVKDVNKIMSLICDYNKLWLLYCCNNNLSLPYYNTRIEINHLLMYLMNKNVKGKIDNDDIMKTFISSNGLNTINKEINRGKNVEIIKNEIDRLIINIKTNIQEHYCNHLKKFIKLFAPKDDVNKLIAHYLNVKTCDKFSKDGEDFIKKYNNILTLDLKYKDKPLQYDLKVNSVKYLKKMYLINKVFEDYNKTADNKIKLFNIVPLKNNYYCNYIQYSSSYLEYLLSTNKDDNVWHKILKFDKLKKILKNKVFALSFDTDGIGCSLLCYKEVKCKKSKKDNHGVNISCDNDKFEMKYLDELKKKELNVLRNKNVVGIDPGKYNILFMTDGIHKLRYTIHQRKTENGIKKRQEYVNNRKTQRIINIETELSLLNSKTNDYQLFKCWMKAKYYVYDELFEFYDTPRFKELKMNIYDKTRKYEHKLMKRIKDTFGDCVLCVGDWSNRDNQRTGETTTNIGIKSKLSKYFNTYKIDEFNTSKLCCRCSNKLEHYKINDKSHYRVLICKDCKTREQYNYSLNTNCLKEQKIVCNDRLFSRDMNACLNMVKLSKCIINNISINYLGHNARKKNVYLDQ